jgi:hypothetical protein
MRVKTTSLATNIALLAGSVVLSLAVLEAGCRLLRSGPDALVHWPNLARERMGNSEDGGCAYAYDETLGWRLPPSECDSPQYGVDADGYRRAPAHSALAEPPVLAAGSSFTLGEEVADGETWPAYLQTRIGRKVVNAGVSGYSLDQAVLRAEQVASRIRPLFVIAGFTPGDVWRNELKVAYSREKPYFAVTDGHLELRNVPVPRPAQGPVPLPLAARLLGRSMLADEIVERLVIRDGWYYDEARAVPPGTGETIACLLMPRLAGLGVPVVVMAQYGRGYWGDDTRKKARAVATARTVLGCAAKAGLLALDLHDPLKAAVEARGKEPLFRIEHHSPEGNRLVADLLVQELVRQQLLAQAAKR